jgi:hypothetical protein
MAAYSGVPRLSPRLIIEALLRNMHESAVEMYSYRIVPSSYRIFLAQTDFDALEPIKSRIIEEANDALDGGLRRLNSPKLFQRITFQTNARYERADSRWQIEILVDPDLETAVGSCAIRSELAISQCAPDKAGTQTRFITTYSDRSTVVAADTVKDESTRLAAPAKRAMNIADVGRIIAELRCTDSNGFHVFQMRKSEILVVTGDSPTEGDVKLSVSGSPEMTLVIRMDSRTGLVALRNLSVPTLAINDLKVAPNVEVLLTTRSLIRIGAHATVEFTAIT